MNVLTPSVAIAFFRHPRLVDAEQFADYRIASLAQLAAAGLEVTSDWAISDDASAIETRRALDGRQPDLLVLAFPAWADETLSLTVLHGYTGACVLWSDFHGLALAGLSGLVSVNSNLLRLGRELPRIVGPLASPEIQAKFVALAQAAAITRALPDVRVGAVGAGCPGMVGIDFGELALARLGPQIVRLDLADLLARAERVPAGMVAVTVRESARADALIESSADDFDRSMRAYHAFRSLADEYRLQVIGVRCWPELRFQHRVTPCLAFSRLMDDGIMGVCENDPAAGVTMLVGHWLSGQPVFLGDISRIDPDQNTLLLWHCGAASMGLACPSCQVQLRPHWSAPLGVQIEFPLRAGRVTIAKLSRPLNGRAQLFVASGEAVETTPTRGNMVEVRLDLPAAQVLKSILDRGVEHHLVVVYGDYAPHFEYLSRVLDLDLVAPAA